MKTMLRSINFILGSAMLVFVSLKFNNQSLNSKPLNMQLKILFFMVTQLKILFLCVHSNYSCKWSKLNLMTLDHIRVK